MGQASSIYFYIKVNYHCLSGWYPITMHTLLTFFIKKLGRKWMFREKFCTVYELSHFLKVFWPKYLSIFLQNCLQYVLVSLLNDPIHLVKLGWDLLILYQLQCTLHTVHRVRNIVVELQHYRSTREGLLEYTCHENIYF